MQFLFEVAVFMVVAVVAFCIVFTIVWGLGYPLDLEGSHAALIAFLTLFFWAPAFANCHIALRGTKETRVERTYAGIRGVGMLICSAGLATPFVLANFSIWQAAVPFILGSILWWGSAIIEDLAT